MIKAVVERLKNFQGVYKVKVYAKGGTIIQNFETSIPKSTMLDWATDLGAKEVTFKL